MNSAFNFHNKNEECKSMLRKYKDVIAGGFVILLGAALYIASLSIKSLPMNLLKADFFPKMAACMFGFLGICLVMEGVKSAKTFDENVEGDEKDGEDNASGTISMVATLALIALYIFCLEPIGFVLSTIVYLVAQMYILADAAHHSKKDIVLFMVLSVITSVGIYQLFTKVFYLMLPIGILG